MLWNCVFSRLCAVNRFGCRYDVVSSNAKLVGHQSAESRATQVVLVDTSPVLEQPSFFFFS